MDGGERERAELARIKQGVKKNRREKRLRSRHSRSTAGNQEPQSAEFGQSITDGAEAQNVDTVTETETHSRENLSSTVLRRLHSSPDLSLHDIDDGNAITAISTPDFNAGRQLSGQSPSQSHLSRSVPTLPPLRILHYREAELLMHYLDHVFHLQFRFHSPSVRTGGRGWLLWLLIRTSPLYHAALSLSALHQHVILHRTKNADHSGTENSFNTTLHELNEYHGRTLQELQVCLQTSHTDTGDPDLGRQIEILACGVQLISFQVWFAIILRMGTADDSSYFKGVWGTGKCT